MSLAQRLALPLILVVAATGCGGGSKHHASAPLTLHDRPLPLDYRAIPAGRGPRYRLSALSSGASRAEQINGLRCQRRHAHSFAIHLELYARGLVLPIPSGIGIAPPVQRSGAYVSGGRCRYPVRTLEPTGLVLVDASHRLTVGGLFAIWGQPLALTRLASFTGPVFAYVNGHQWIGTPGQIPLQRHAQIVLEADGHVPPHASYQFPPGR